MSSTTTTAAATNRWYLSAAPIARALVHLCVPMAAAMVVSALYNVINAGFIGAQHDTSLLAAITFGTPLLGLVSIAYWVTWLQRNSENVSFAPKWFTLRADILKPVFGIGVGELLQSAFLIVTTLVLNNLAAAYGDDPLAAMGVAVRIAQVPEFLVMGVTIGVLPLLAYAFGAGDADRLRSGLRAAALTVGGIVLVFSGTVFVFREQVFTIFSGDHSVLAIGMTILTAQLVAAVVNGFTGLLTSLFQATGMVMPAMVLSMAQGVLFIPIVIAGNVWFGLAGIIWALTVTEGIVFVAAVVLWLATRGRIARGLAEGSAARADAALEATPVA
ncbi:MATE family efflux transporter [Curtobacterium flaccumfaciens]|uniref:MATE family efflux transporter n=1 Tax=Curtobacterium flaccumfaciens TaxID=2035 RepID=UPI003EB8BC24